MILIAIGANYNLFMRLNAGQIQESGEFNWVEVKKAYDIFLNYPDEKNTCKLSSLLPNKKYHFSDGKLAEEVTSYMKMDWSNYQILECEAYFGNYFAAEAIYRLISISDAASTETLLDSLSTLIRIKPENLLGVLYENGWDDFRLKGIMQWLLFLGDHGNDVYIYNNSMRIKAIESVSDARFGYLKKRCISILKNEIEDIKKYREK
mgnify:CR=1 FL=1